MPPPASSPSWTQSFLDKLMGRGQDEQQNSFLLPSERKAPPTDSNQPRMRASTPQESREDWLNQWELPLAGGAGTFIKENVLDPLDALGPIGKAGSVIPKRLWDKRIAKLVEGMRRDIPFLNDIPRAEKFVSDAGNFLDLHKPMAAHTGNISLHSPASYERTFGDTISKGHYSGGGNRWSLKDPSKTPTVDPVTGRPDTSHLKPEDFERDRVRVLTQLKNTMGDVRKAGRTGGSSHPLTGNMTDEQMESILDRILNNEIHLKENPDWDNPLSRLFTLRHEMTHGAQDIGKSAAYDESGLKFMLGDPNATDASYWLDPVEIGARASEYKAPFDAVRIMGRGDAITPEIWDKGVDTSGRYLRSLRSGINNAIGATRGTADTGFDFLNELRKGYIPELNKQFLDPSHKIQSQILAPGPAKKMGVSAGAVPQSISSSENWNWGPEDKYSLILDQFGRPIGK